MKSQMKIGAVISYINIVLNMGVSIFLIPFLISSLGESEYGVYRIIQSFAGQLAIVSFGIATLVVRYMVYYETKGELKEKENFLFFAKLITAILSLIVVIIGCIMYVALDTLYSAKLSSEELELAKKLMAFFVLNTSICLVCDSYTGIITAHERFAMSNGSKTIKLVLRTVLIIVLLKLGGGALSIVIIDTLISFFVLIIVWGYGKFVLHEKSKFHHFDKILFRDCLTFAFAIFLQTIVNQVNQNLDNVIIGSMCGSEDVTIYSVGLTIFTTFNTLVSAIGGLFAPKATRMVAKNASGEELTDLVIHPGRFQFMIACLAVGGFLLVGKDFITLWVGDKFLLMYPITMLLLIPSIIPLIETVTTSILDAMMKRLGRSLILIAMCVINLAVSIVCINSIGFTGAAIGTAVSFIVGHGILLNIYLYRVTKINIIRMFKDIVHNTITAAILSVVVCLPLLLFVSSNWGIFLFKSIVFVLVYLLSVYFIGMNKEEKNIVMGMIKKIIPTPKKEPR